MASEYPELEVERTRSGVVETVSAVVAAIAGPDNRVQTWGAADRRFPARSTIKPIQAVALVADSAASAFGFETSDLALACASHNGEDVHADAVTRMLIRSGHGPDDLLCPPAFPLIEELAYEYAARGGAAERVRHNCSGKHAGFLALARALGEDAADYLDPCSRTQRRVMDEVGTRIGRRLAEDDLLEDGCGAPTPAVSMIELAHAWANLSEGVNSPGETLLSAMASQPALVGGTFRFDTHLTTLSGGRVISKVGADGLHVAVDRNAGVGFAVKAISGDRIAAQQALQWLLAWHDSLRGIDPWVLHPGEVHDDSGRVVGEIRVLG